MRIQRKVCISGGFDPFHEGHLEYVLGASELGDYLIVLVSNDDDMIRKKGKCNLPLLFRVETVRLWMKEYGVNGMVIPTMDTDGTQIETLRTLKPDIYAEGGDITPENINKGEEAVCKEIGCKIIYGVGGLSNSKLNSSSRMTVEQGVL